MIPRFRVVFLIMLLSEVIERCWGGQRCIYVHSGPSAESPLSVESHNFARYLRFVSLAHFFSDFFFLVTGLLRNDRVVPTSRSRPAM